MINYVHDLYTQLHYLDPAMWPSFEQFVADHYFPGYKIISPSQIVGVERNLERLRRQLTAVTAIGRTIPEPRANKIPGTVTQGLHIATNNVTPVPPRRG